ncbi:MAG TPA: zinc-dependent alcohol dehydrogenase [Phycisphaerales bacterium]|nr:zinc-dependent alcohol dehydrogenase [Phycisphaerales bacterium]
MRATCWFGVGDIRVADVPDPQIINPRDAIIRVTLTAICGSDLHLYDGFIPTMKRGDILGHEFMGEVVEVGSAVTNLSPGDRVVVPFNIACGRCFFCRSDQWSLCDNSNPTPQIATALYGHSPAGLFGYSHMMGGYAGGQAEYVRVPFADVGPLKVPDGIPDEKVLFLSDIFPTGYQAAENCAIEPGDTVAVWGCGPVGQFAVRSALLLGAERVIAIDHHAGRLDLATRNGVRKHNGVVETLNFDQADIYDALMEMTGGRGPDRCIDAVGLEAHGVTVDNIYDRMKVATKLATDRIHVLRQVARCCRKGGTISIPGVYGGFADKFPIGAIFEKGLTLRTGQTHVHRYMRPLLERIERDEIDPSFVISHRLNLDDASDAYAEFKHNQDGCFKVVLRP